MNLVDEGDISKKKFPPNMDHGTVHHQAAWAALEEKKADIVYVRSGVVLYCKVGTCPHLKGDVIRLLCLLPFPLTYQ